MDKTIALKDVIPRMAPQEIKNDLIHRPSPSPSKMTNSLSSNYVSPQQNTNMPINSPLNKQPILSNNDKNYNNNRNSNPRSNSQGNNNNLNTPNSNYPSSGGGYYNSRPANINSGGRPTNYPNMNNPPPSHGYQPNYPQHFYNPQPTMYPSRYPPAYPHMPPQPMGPQVMYPPMNKPVPGMYNPPVPNLPMGGMYPPINNPNQLNQYEEAMFNEAFVLVNDIKNSNLSDYELTSKKSRLNYILSSHPKVHTKLKDSLLPQQQS